MPKIVGSLIETEFVRAYVREGENPRPAYPRLHVLDGREVLRVNAKDFEGTLPSEGDHVDLDVFVTAYLARGGAPTVSYGLIRVNNNGTAHKAA